MTEILKEGYHCMGIDMRARQKGSSILTRCTSTTVVGLLLLLAVVVIPPSLAGAQGSNGPFAYIVTATGKVSEIDLGSGSVIGSVAVNQVGLRGLAITPNGATAYVANYTDNTVTPINTATNKAGTPITVGDIAEGIAISPDGTTAYVVNEGSNSVTPIDTASNTAGTPIPVGSSPAAIAITPDGATAYVANEGNDTVTPIDTVTNTAGTPIPVGNGPTAIAIAPNGATAYVVNEGGNSVTPINTASNTTGAPITVGGEPIEIAITPDGTTAYVTDYASTTVTPVDLTTGAPESPISVGSSMFGPDGVAVTPDGSTAYVTYVNSNAVVPIDTATNTAGVPISLGSIPYATAIAIVPDQGPAASLSATTAGSTTTFDAAGSVADSSPISSYAWNFGDGQTATTSIPTTTHTYASGGTYTATVTETDAAGTSTTQVFTGQTASLEGGPEAEASATVVIASADCSNQNSCTTSLTAPATQTAPAQTVTVQVPAPGQPSQALTVTSGPGALVCATKHFTLVSSVTSYATTFAPSSDVTVTDLIAGATSTHGVKICFQSISGSPSFLPTCSVHTPAPCVTLAVVAGGVEATISVPPGDPRFRVDGVATLIESPSTISSKGTIGKTVKIKGTDLLGSDGQTVPQLGFTSANGSTVGGMIASKSATEIVVKVPNGAATGPVDMVWQNVEDGVAQTETMVSESSITIK